MNNENLTIMTPQVGKILIASPFLDNTAFERTVILLLTNENGFMGIVMNKISHSPATANSLLDNLKDGPSIPLYDGGIVDKDVLFCVHKNRRVKNSLWLKDNLFVNGDFTQIEEMAKKEKTLNKKARFYIGYAGWSEGQLEQEIMDGSWVVSNADVDLLFADDISQMWSTALKRMGEPYSIWAQFPLGPLFN